MKQEDKQLLLKDLCRRLPYGVKVTTTNPAVKIGIISGISIKNKISVETKHANIVFDCTEVKPYLRPMSSMTEEEEKEFLRFKKSMSFIHDLECLFMNQAYKHDIAFPHYYDYFVRLEEWLIKHHFDYHGLIERGLAIEAPEGMYNQ